MQIGASFSHTHLKSLGIAPLEALKAFKKLGLTWIRLGCYWNEIENKKGVFNFSKILPLVEYCEKNNINILMTIGMKAPRWPEYYLPEWLLSKTKIRKASTLSTDNSFLFTNTTSFVNNCVKKLKKYKSIKIWQVENEPLDPSGPKWLRISPEMLQKEVESVKKIDPERKILINCWGNELTLRKVYKKILPMCDFLGLDIYLKHPAPILKWFHRYLGPLDSHQKLIQIAEEIKSKGNKLWITELQAEPWEADKIISEKKNPPSFPPNRFAKNLNFVLKLKPDVVLFWGFEYWYWRRKNGDPRYWLKAKETIKTISQKQKRSS